MRGELRAEETFASIRAEPATSPAPVQPFFLKHARLVASGAVRPKSLDLKLEHHSTHRLFCLVAQFNVQLQLFRRPDLSRDQATP
jgi:hypothetical protein